MLRRKTFSFSKKYSTRMRIKEATTTSCEGTHFVPGSEQSFSLFTCVFQGDFSEQAFKSKQQAVSKEFFRPKTVTKEERRWE